MTNTEQENGQEKKTVSRKDFLRGAAATAGGAALLGLGLGSAQADTPSDNTHLSGDESHIPGLEVAHREVTAAHTVTEDDTIIDCDASGGAFAVTLESVTGERGRLIIVSKTDASANQVTVKDSGGSVVATLAEQDEVVKLYAHSSGWRVVP